MEDQNSRRDSDPAAPSDDPLDAALAKLEASRNTVMADVVEDDDTELDAGEDESTQDVDHTAEEPETDEDKVVVVNTPTKPEKVKVLLDSDATPDKEENDDDAPQMSRKQRGKLIEQVRQELEESNRKLREQELAQQATFAENERLDKEVLKALGSDEDFEKAEDDALAGDEDAIKKRKIWKANRKFFQKLVSKAERDVQMAFANTYWSTVENLPGVDREILAHEKQLSAVLKHIYEAGSTTSKDVYETKLQDLQDELLTVQEEFKNFKKKAKSAGKRSPVVDGDSSPVEPLEFDWRKRKDLLDPKTGLPTDEMDQLIKQHGVNALSRNIKLRG